MYCEEGAVVVCLYPENYKEMQTFSFHMVQGCGMGSIFPRRNSMTLFCSRVVLMVMMVVGSGIFVLGSPFAPGNSEGSIAYAQRCPEGYRKDLLGRCVEQRRRQCPAGYKRNFMGVCVREQRPRRCPPGFKLDILGQCVEERRGLRCPPGYRIHQGRCVPRRVETCPPGYVMRNGRCVRRRPQPNPRRQCQQALSNCNYMCSTSAGRNMQHCLNQCQVGYNICLSNN